MVKNQKTSPTSKQSSTSHLVLIKSSLWKILSNPPSRTFSRQSFFLLQLNFVFKWWIRSLRFFLSAPSLLSTTTRKITIISNRENLFSCSFSGVDERIWMSIKKCWRVMKKYARKKSGNPIRGEGHWCKGWLII